MYRNVYRMCTEMYTESVQKCVQNEYKYVKNVYRMCKEMCTECVQKSV